MSRSRPKARPLSLAHDVLRLPRLPGVLRPVFLGLAGLILLPYVLTPLYAFMEPASTVMIWRRIVGEPVVRTYVPLSRISPNLQLAVIIAEDGRFCDHHGIDFEGLRSVIDSADTLEDMRGGSTITQQVAKNLFLWSSRSYLRKALEAPLALWIDLILSKRRILEIYLNVAEWGPDGQFGVEAGAEYAFHRSARDLSRYQAALLASVLPNPHDRSARRPGPGLRRLAGLYEARSGRSPGAAACVRGR
jgi:monofunctional biosynthetic peptidoglycan transglycosylase